MPDWSVILLAFLFALAVAFISAQVTVWHGRHIVSSRQPSEIRPFSDLVKLGFHPPQAAICHYIEAKLREQVAVIGQVDGYAVEVSFNQLASWSVAPHYIVRVFFNTDTLTQSELLTRSQNNLAKSKFYRWNDYIKLSSTYVVQTVGPKRFHRIDGKYLLGMAEQLIAELRKLGLRPVSYEEGVSQWILNQE